MSAYRWFSILAVMMAAASSCVVWSPADPRLMHGQKPADICAANRAGDLERAMALSRRDLDAHVGEPAPDLVLIDWHRNVVRTSSMRGKRVAFLAALFSSPESMAWMKELQSAHWQPPEGFDDLVILIAAGKTHEWDALVRACPRAYLVGWPLTGFYSSLNWQPAMLAVGRDGRFEGYWSHGEQAVAPLVGNAPDLAGGGP